MNDIALGVELMGYGLLGVFTVLLIFYGLIIAICKIFPQKRDN